MMQVAILSDIHANRHALGAVLAAIDDAGVAETWCLGDVVGYGADPGACVALVREHASVCLAGNHDLAAVGVLDLDDFSSGAAIAARWTQTELSEDDRAWLAALPSSDADRAVGLYHASPRDPVWEYVLSTDVAARCLDVQDHAVCLVGHSHVALSFAREPDGPTAGELRVADEALDLSAGEWLLNPGSVGQPRDRDPRAAWMLLDLDAQRAEFRRVDYDVEGAARAIRDAGLPDSLAKRLKYGQ